MLTKKYNILTLLITAALSSVLSILLFSFTYNNNESKAEETPIKSVEAAPSCETQSHRMEGFKFIKPLLYNSKTCESGNYYGLKINIMDAIKQYQQKGELDNASVYFKTLNTRDFFNINENEKYHPASLIKLPVLIAFLKMEEKTPGILDKKLVFHLPKDNAPHQTFSSHQIEPEKSYTIRELLKYMIAYSDNNATFLLNNNLDLELFKKMFSDFGLEIPDIHDQEYQISAKDYSVFLNVVYNAGYLTIPNSEFVTDLLDECDFNAGIKSGIPDNINIVHKFGEWGDRNNSAIHQLSESGIIYFNHAPYILTIMTQGKEINKLPAVMSNISKTVFDYLKKNETNL